MKRISWGSFKFLVSSFVLQIVSQLETWNLQPETQGTEGAILNRYGVFNRGLRKLSTLGEFLGGTVEPVYLRTPEGLTATLGWGRRKYARRARRVAQAKGIPFLCLEDGFLRSVGLGNSEPPLSIVVDDLGIYYDATNPSRLDSQIARPLTSRETARARAIITAWRKGRVSKYNYAPDHAGGSPGALRVGSGPDLGRSVDPLWDVG